MKNGSVHNALKRRRPHRRRGRQQKRRHGGADMAGASPRGWAHWARARWEHGAAGAARGEAGTSARRTVATANREFVPGRPTTSGDLILTVGSHT
nr:unnamed protein product [Digitaria exilis]